MKIKLLILSLILPFTAIGATTNIFDRVLIRDSLVVTGAYDSVKGLIMWPGGATNIYVLAGQAFDSSQRLSINWNGRTLNRDTGPTIVNWQSGTYNAEDGSASILTTTANRKLRKGATTILDWGNQTLHDNTGVQLMNWEARTTNVGWTNQGSFVVTNGIFAAPYIGINTNSVDPADGYTVVIRPAPGALNNAGILMKVPAGGSTSISGQVEGASSYLWSLSDDAAGVVRMVASGTGFTAYRIILGGNIMLDGNATTLSLGASSSSALTFNGSTITIPHNAQINTDVLRIPAAGGTITNGTSLTVLNTLTVSNLVVQGASTWSSGTNGTLTILSNGGSGSLVTSAKYNFVTNTESATAFAVNTIYTNANQRMTFDGNLVFNANSAVFFYTVSGSQTNIFSRKFFAAQGTNNVTGYVQPNGLYVISNYVGTVTPLVGEFTRILE